MKNLFAHLVIAGLCLLMFSYRVMAHGNPLEKVWELDGLMNPESVVYDSMTDALYVSNVNGAPTEKDGNGFITKVSLDGKILDKEWVKGLDAPKGLAIYNGKLYTADIDTLVQIDIATASVTRRYSVSDAKFLNDVAASSNGEIYVSDMVMNRIHVLKDGSFSIWLESPDLLNPNGLLVQGDKLIEGAWGVMTDGFATPIPGHLQSISLADKSITVIGDGTPVGNMDGVEPYLDGEYYVTDWMAGKLYHIHKNGEPELLLTLEQGMADLGVNPAMNMIYLPMMNNNKLIAYKAH